MPTQQISGTIYQMYDASGNNRRFPVTVVDGVLGLRSYMEEQFSSLANLYMPIDYVLYNSTTQVLTVGGVPVDLANLSNYYNKNEADGRFLGINANAASATKLQTARTIWGQSFDGTANVTGAMSGVTSIDSLINIESGYVGIGKTPSVALDVNGQVQGTQLLSTVTSSAPLVVNSTIQVDNLTSQYATNPKSELKTGQEFVFRKTNVEWDAKSGVIKKIKGKSVAVNQFFSYNDADWRGTAGTISFNGMTATLTPAVSYAEKFCDAAPIIAGHKYYTKMEIVQAFGMGVRISESDSSSFINETATPGVYSSIKTATLNCNLIVVCSGTSSEQTIIKNVQFIDLTLMFGAGNEPSTVAEFEALYPDIYPYNPGTLISNDAEAVETTGVNQWDEEWELGDYNQTTGVIYPGDAYIISKNYCACGGSLIYYKRANYDISNYGFWLNFYDAEKRYISNSGNGAYSTMETSPSNAKYFKVIFATGAYGKSYYDDDICINLSNPAINGQYFPYWKRTLQLGITTRKDTDGNVPFADGMKGAGTAADWADKVGGEKRMKRVDLGSLEWYLNGDVFYAYIEDIKTADYSGVANAICSKYPITSWGSMTDKTASIFNAYTIGINIKDSSISSSDIDSQGKIAKLNGVMLDYELATPVPFTWKEPLPSVYPCDQFGTERVISPVSVNPSAPFCADIQYGAKSDDIANDLIGTRAVVDTLLTSERPALFSTVTATDAITLAGTTAAKKRIYFSDSVYLELDSNGLHLHGAGFYSDSFISAFGTNQTI